MKILMSVKNLVGDGSAREGEYFKSPLEVTLSKDETLLSIELCFCPNGLSLREDNQRYYIEGVIQPLEEWTDIQHYESKRGLSHSDDDLVGGQISLTNQTPLTYGYLRKMNKENPDWLHYSGINYSLFGKSAYIYDNGNYISELRIKVEYGKIKQTNEYSVKFPIIPMVNPNDFIERYKRNNSGL